MSLFQINSNKDSKGVFKGADGWAALLKGHQLTIESESDWKFVYSNGRLISMISPQNKTVDLIYSGKQVSEVRQASLTLLQVRSEKNSGVINFIFPKEKVTVTRLKSNLVIVEEKNGVTKLEFSENNNDQNTLSISSADGNERHFSWNKKTGCITSDSNWNYSIKPLNAKSFGDSAHIDRSNSLGMNESWHFSRGQEIYKDTNGVEHISTYLVNPTGPSKLRKVETIKDGDRITDYRASFNEKGQLIRASEKSNESSFKYNDKGQIIEIRGKNGITIKREYNGAVIKSERYFLPNGAEISLLFTSPNTVSLVLLTRSSGFLCVEVDTDDVFNVLGYDPRTM